MEENKKEAFYPSGKYQIQKKESMELSSSMEDYLEMTYRLCMEDGYTRTGKLSKMLQVRPSSVTKMIGRLKEYGFVYLDSNGSIQLLEKGIEKAEYLLYRHNILEAFLEFLGNQEPLQETEILEHAVSSFTVSRIHTLLVFIRENKEIERQWDLWEK